MSGSRGSMVYSKKEVLKIKISEGGCIQLLWHTPSVKAATRHGFWSLLLSIYQIKHVG